MVSIAFWSFPINVDTDPDHTQAWIILPSSQQSSFSHGEGQFSFYFYTFTLPRGFVVCLNIQIGYKTGYIPHNLHICVSTGTTIFDWFPKTQYLIIIFLLALTCYNIGVKLIFLDTHKYLTSPSYPIHIYIYNIIYNIVQYTYTTSTDTSPVGSASYFIYLGRNLPGESPISEKPMRSRSVSGKNARVYCHIWSVKDG